MFKLMFFIMSMLFLCGVLMDYFIVIMGLFFGMCVYVLKIYGGGVFGFMHSDFLSFFLVLMSFLIIIFMYYVSMYLVYTKGLDLFYIIILLAMLTSLILVFFISKIILFYIFFEAALIPIFLLVAGWGSNYEKLESSIYMFMYTLAGSLPFLAYIGMYTKYLGGLDFFSFSSNLMLGLPMGMGFMILAFLVKIPLYGVHLWLPKAHVEAPVSGSMILAGVLLKMGGYGLMRMFFIMKTVGGVEEYGFLISIGLMGGAYLSLQCVKQVDLKMLVAYSSVVHMALVVGGLASLRLLSWKGSIYLMLGHGFCSSCIFFLLGVIYDRVGSRSMVLNKGIFLILPSFGIWWFIACIGNISNPPSMSLFGEIMLMSSVLNYKVALITILLLIFFLVSCYTVHLFSQVFHGACYKLNIGYFKMSVNEMFVPFMHLFYLNSMFLLLK